MPSLVNLPPELLLDICETLYKADKKLALSTVSKLFVPLARHVIFRDVTVYSYKKLASLCDIVERTLLSWQASSTSPLSCLTSLTDLVVAGSCRIARLVLEVAGDGPILGAMVKLTVDSSFREIDNPFDPLGLMRLERYPALTSLDLKVCRRPRQAYASPSPLPTLSLTTLNLGGFLHDNPAVLDLISSCTRLTSLSLFEYDHKAKSAFPPLLTAIPDPLQITTLALAQDTKEPIDFAAALAPFAGLAKFALDCGSLTPLLPILHTFPHLSTLAFCQNASPCIVDLLTLLESYRPPRLVALEFHHITSTRIKLDGVPRAAKAVGVKTSGYIVGVVEQDMREKAEVEREKKEAQAAFAEEQARGVVEGGSAGGNGQ
ncbi:hypothetical protein JCM8547_008657 [Rhodosporidiobolus lusitaniae]